MALHKTIELTETERDSFSETFNIGVSRAAAALSEMVGNEVQLSIPALKIVAREQLAFEHEADAQSRTRIVGVSEQFHGALQGRALLLFPEAGSLELVRALLQEDVDLDFLTEMEQEALTEVGNIILNACLGSVADLIEGELGTDIPVPLKGEWSEIILDEVADDDYVLTLHVDFMVQAIDVAGYIAILMGIESIDEFRMRLAALYSAAIS